MSFNRVIYDSAAYDLKMKRSTQPGDYFLDETFAENNNQCFSAFGPIGSKADVSTTKKKGDTSFTNMTDIESQLSWRVQKLNKYNKNHNINTKENKSKIHHKTDCANKLTSEDTRFTHPIDDFRGMSLTSFYYDPYFHVNPQCYIQKNNDRIGVNSRLYSKDSYVPVKQKAWDTGEALPNHKK